MPKSPGRKSMTFHSRSERRGVGELELSNPVRQLNACGRNALALILNTSLAIAWSDNKLRELNHQLTMKSATLLRVESSFLV